MSKNFANLTCEQSLPQTLGHQSSNLFSVASPMYVVDSVGPFSKRLEIKIQRAIWQLALLIITSKVKPTALLLLHRDSTTYL